jgi:hypothetical protein
MTSERTAWIVGENWIDPEAILKVLSHLFRRCVARSLRLLRGAYISAIVYSLKLRVGKL